MKQKVIMINSLGRGFNTIQLLRTLISVPHPHDISHIHVLFGIVKLDYLFAVRRQPDGTLLSKFDQIMVNLFKILEDYPPSKGYTIHITGHSLGGALSSLFAFRLASLEDPRIPKPITCITVASPRVGNIRFRRAFQVRPAAFHAFIHSFFSNNKEHGELINFGFHSR